MQIYGNEELGNLIAAKERRERKKRNRECTRMDANKRRRKNSRKDAKVNREIGLFHRRSQRSQRTGEKTLSPITFPTHICVYPRSLAVVLDSIRVYSRPFAVVFASIPSSRRRWRRPCGRFL